MHKNEKMKNNIDNSSNEKSTNRNSIQSYDGNKNKYKDRVL
jgi:hypothetical protein